MKFGFRIPNLNKRIAARTSVKRIIRHNFGFKAPRGWGWITDPNRAAYNRVYNRTSRGCILTLIWLISIPMLILLITLQLSSCSGNVEEGVSATYLKPSVDKNGRFRKEHVRKSVSTKKNAVKSQNRSRYYYHTRGKYNRK